MSYFFQTAATAATQNEMGFSESFWMKVLDEYGMLGITLLGIIVGVILFIRYATKKLDNEEKKGEREDDIKATMVKVSGLLEQVKREADSHQTVLDAQISEIKKDTTATQAEISKIGIIAERDSAEVRREFSEVKSQLRDIQRDLYPRERNKL